MSDPSLVFYPDQLLHHAIQTALTTAMGPGVSVELALDTRLPDQIAGDASLLADLCRALLAWVFGAVGLQAVTLALWRGAIVRNMPGTMRLEATGFGPDSAPPLPATVLALVARLQGDVQAPLVRPGAVAAMVDLPMQAAERAQPIADRFARLFHGTRLLVVGEISFARDPLIESLRSLGIEAVHVATPAAAIEAVAAARSLRPFDMVLVSTLAGDPIRTLRALRDLAGGAPARVLLTGPMGDLPLPEELALGVSLPAQTVPFALVDRLADAMGAGRAGAPPPRTPIPDLTGARILIAEDVVTNQTMMRAMLEPTGAEIDIAEDGEQAVAMHQARPYSLVLMDIQMPRMDGLEAARAIRATGAPVPIIALTAHAKTGDRARYLAAGMDSYLAKPLRMAELYALVARYCRPVA